MSSHSGRRQLAEKTLLLTGLARSGTSMLAAVIQTAGVWLGDHVYAPINEDAEITQMLRARDLYRLGLLIERQNARTTVWVFKMPDLHQFLQHDELQRFPRNPHLLIIYRDAVAVAVRNVLSEQYEGIQTLLDTTAAMHALAQFARASALPFLFLSYEKALLFPHVFIDSILTFCDIAVRETERAAMLQHVQPDRAQYVMTGNRRFEGHLEGLVDGRLAATFSAVEFRGDLLAANLGNGNHAFFLDLDGLEIVDTSVIRVRVNRRTFELANSGLSFAALKALRASG